MMDTDGDGKQDINSKSNAHIWHLAIGIIVISLNSFQIAVILRVKRKKTFNEAFLLSISVADTLYGLSKAVISLLFFDRELSQGIDYIILINFVPLVISIMHLGLMALERLLMVYKPYWHRRHTTHKRVYSTLAAVWTSCSLLFIAQILWSILNSERGRYLKRTTTTLCVLILACGVGLVISYTMMTYKIIQTRKKVQPDANNDTTQFRRRREMNIARISILVSAVFIICTFPYAIHYLAERRYSLTTDLLLLVHSGMNSIVYFFRGLYVKHKANRMMRVASKRMTVTMKDNTQNTQNKVTLVSVKEAVLIQKQSSTNTTS